MQKPTSAKIKSKIKYEYIDFLVGYVSSDFGNRPMGHDIQSRKNIAISFFIFIVFRFHNRDKYEIYCYSLSPTDNSSWWANIVADADVFRDISDVAYFFLLI